MTAPARPVLRYHGGKWRLAPWIIGHFPAHRVYVEPFGGAGSVLLRKPRAYAEVYNDLDGELVNLFHVARDRGPALSQALRLTPFARREFIDSYQPSSDCLEQARRTVVRSFMGFGSNSHNKRSGFRNNSNRCGTTPAHDWANYPQALEQVIDRLRGVVIESKDAVSLIGQMDGDGTLFYVDPPYVLSTRDKGHDYRHEMTDADHESLAQTLHRVKGFVVLSGYPNRLYARLFPDWQCIERHVFADGARQRVECLWLNPPCSAALIGQQAQQRLIA
ncbi:DNA adenine methylase [Verminephrobacter eiseniae]|uniref:D12 class N6 adenine-specific DNA methyltransferase n=1 Tax=Verminephrobacter eiseniae (strain EF01-2) TaxID=391735 RepID=A1WPB3_VEREI|nr:DNA adenine methylase [Verminephrobacter eiseniae]ABM59470.1 D12 class N6 adenine-specific DNA methyltransferase [Verminephrobacter eiseniae EF01-2]MCW5284993.1 DNA adenine methylase [Verminephrobacter eiseniae]MCW5302701.1 DNA adenine methylase [Verminephrobacter eiseniae]MCW8178240.1 DNA adenine methylase [Verminephrobacter eiseniae]MCW8188970.1 DNA adenine methylase [Verminephrobacter eiseniae]